MTQTTADQPVILEEDLFFIAGEGCRHIADEYYPKWKYIEVNRRQREFLMRHMGFWQCHSFLPRLARFPHLIVPFKIADSWRN